MSAKRPTQSDVAKRAGVSRGTVSLVLNKQFDGPVPISKSTQERVLQAVKEIGYSPNPVAQMLTKGSNNIIGVFSYEQEFPFKEEHKLHFFLEGIEHEASQMGYDILLFTRHRTSKKIQIFNNDMNSLRLADGTIILGAKPDFEEIKSLASENYPFVFIGKREIPEMDVDWVVSDYEAGGYEGTQHLIQQGHSHLAFFGETEGEMAMKSKLQGCQKAVDETKGAKLSILTPPPSEKIKMFVNQIKKEKITALICRDMDAYQILRQILKDTQIKVPDDLSVISFSSTNPKLYGENPTVIDVKPRLVGEIAVRALIDQLEGNDKQKQHHLVSCKLIHGATVALYSS